MGERVCFGIVSHRLLKSILADGADAILPRSVGIDKTLSSRLAIASSCLVLATGATHGDAICIWMHALLHLCAWHCSVFSSLLPSIAVQNLRRWQVSTSTKYCSFDSLIDGWSELSPVAMDRIVVP